LGWGLGGVYTNKKSLIGMNKTCRQLANGSMKIIKG
jgi:hypothetical protein